MLTQVRRQPRSYLTLERSANEVNIHKLVLMISGALVVARSVVLMRRKEYRLFPVWYFVFLLGSLLLVGGVRRFIEGDWTLLPGPRYSGQAWYQDLGLGLTMATVAIVCCVIYVERKTQNNPVQRNARSRLSSSDSPASATSSAPASGGLPDYDRQ